MTHSISSTKNHAHLSGKSDINKSDISKFLTYLCAAMMNHLPKAQKAVATWLYIGVGMLVVQVILGGITRLTGSGLSITEWNVLNSKGFLPPLNEQQWLTEFSKYKLTPQYQLLNTG